MKLRVKVFLFSAIAISIFFLFISVTLSGVLLSNFQKLENDNTKENTERFVEALNASVDNLSVKLSDWAQWDDTYAFVQDKNEDYVNSNLKKEALSLLHINFVVINDEDGNIIFKKAVGRSGEEFPFPTELEKYFVASGLFLEGAGDSVRDHKGLINSSDNLIAIASKSVTSSDGISQRKGNIAFGFLIDESVINQLADTTHLKLSFAPFLRPEFDDGFDIARKNISSENSIFVEETNDPNAISGFALVNDVFGKPAVIFRAEMHRNIFSYGKEVELLFNKIIAFIGVVFVLIVFLLFEFLVLRPIFRLIEGVKKVGRGESADNKVVFSGKDEFSQLGREINKTISDCQISETKKIELEKTNIKIDTQLQNKNKELKQTIADLEKMNSLMSGRELRMIELKEKIKKLEEEKEELLKKVS
jgi:sensor domain CHASE-containing protein